MQAKQAAPVDLEGFRLTMSRAGVGEVVDMILEVYVEEATPLFEDLRAAVDEGDTERVRAVSHSLKSSSGNIWARDAAALFETMEGAASMQDVAAIEETFALLGPEFDRVMDFLSSAGVP
jgi:HPt (histidine-containing phosphotransfer) domain-containing protein